MTQHTAGPWTAKTSVIQDGGGGKSYFEISEVAGMKHICHKHIDGPMSQEHEANAKLIAQAPAMLAALESAKVLLQMVEAMGMQAIECQAGEEFAAEIDAAIEAATA